MSPSVVGSDDSQTLVISPLFGEDNRYVEYRIEQHSISAPTSIDTNVESAKSSAPTSPTSPTGPSGPVVPTVPTSPVDATPAEPTSPIRPGASKEDGFDLVRTVVDGSRLTDEVEEKYLLRHPVGRQSPQCPKHLRSLTIIDSKKAGKNGTGDLYFGVLSPLLHELGCSHVYVATNGPNTIREHAQSFSSSATVVIIGGDTSVHEFVDALPEQSLRQDMRLVVIPTGTGNALALSLGITSPIVAMRRLLMGNSNDFRPLASVRLQFPNEPMPTFSLVVASWGLHSAIVADSDTPELREFGNERFKIAARNNLEDIKQIYKGTVIGDEAAEAHAGYPEHSYLLFTTVTQLEPGFLISPRSDPPSSTKLWAVRIPVLDDPKHLMDIMYKVYDHGAHTSDERVAYFGTSKPTLVEVDASNEPRMRRWCIDGRIVTSEPGTVRIDAPSLVCKGWDLKILT